MNWRTVLFALFLLPVAPAGIAQPAPPDESAYAASLIGITVLGNPSLTVSSVDGFTNGVTVNHNTLQLNLSLGLTWSLQVRALDDLRYQSYSIPASAIGMQSAGLGARPELLLTTTNQTLASGVATSLLSTALPIRYRTVGGSAFLKPAGSYSTTILFTFTPL
ncbi:hypothetical protein [Spirosoma rhododendri]|uniref:Uncharacterized protein n=1 Tax=Spirosoma rhododendri TaxID=2728024 RepID=A0A7L5DR65_9BACT|nr:hypothetical protein [Spirosoma rhododendri]QJD80984.1 hypothetical protein HH216_23090 [Spirosoma rhododendri]